MLEVAGNGTRPCLCHVQWLAGFTDRLETADVTSVDDLDRLLDALTTRALDLAVRFDVNVDPGDGTSMAIVVGGHTAVVEWTRDDPWDCQVSTADDTDDGVVHFAGGGQFSELPRQLWIEVALARQAIRHYVATGELTPRVRWEPF
jgi:Immunity protein Imm1